jgi:hypothetical protein
MAIRRRRVRRRHRARSLDGRLFRRYPVALLPSLATGVAHLRSVCGLVCHLFAGSEVNLGTLFSDSSRWRALAPERHVGCCYRVVYRASIESRVPCCPIAPNHLLDR